MVSQIDSISITRLFWIFKLNYRISLSGKLGKNPETCNLFKKVVQSVSEYVLQTNKP